jgi:hypothetical protein
MAKTAVATAVEEKRRREKRERRASLRQNGFMTSRDVLVTFTV